MFARSESARERTLLRLIESQQRIIADQQREISDLANRIMYMANKPWELPLIDEPITHEPEPEPFEIPELMALDEAM